MSPHSAPRRRPSPPPARRSNRIFPTTGGGCQGTRWSGSRRPGGSRIDPAGAPFTNPINRDDINDRAGSSILNINGGTVTFEKTATDARKVENLTITDGSTLVFSLGDLAANSAMPPTVAGDRANSALVTGTVTLTPGTPVPAADPDYESVIVTVGFAGGVPPKGFSRLVVSFP